ncbi:MAG: hypothetical protein GC165_01635 [Armatimonadetes bacterium]|nr:hypothetical protein [Armatimonadota bacterium]MBS1727016.1 hypothetical protein [Armatimonadota bacterium]
MGYDLSFTPDSAEVKVEIDGYWTVSDLQGLLTNLEQAYARLSAISLIGSAISQNEDSLQISKSERREVLQKLSRLESLSPGEDQDHLISSVIFECSRNVEVLRLKSLHYNSPGWITAIGSLGPLRTLVELIKDRREQETKRQQQAFEHEIRLKELEVQREKDANDKEVKLAEFEVEKKRIEADMRKTYAGHRHGAMNSDQKLREGHLEILCAAASSLSSSQEQLAKLLLILIDYSSDSISKYSQAIADENRVTAMYLLDSQPVAISSEENSSLNEGAKVASI